MAVFAVTIFAGAFLLFQVQPLIGKFVLPWFGGGPGVWSTCMLFFQTVLLAGYAYAHFTVLRLTPRVHFFLHTALLAGAILFLPIIPSGAWKPGPEANPVLWITGLLTLTLWLPCLLLASTGPLVQRWFANNYPAASPYRLYALSNAGSLLALISYPFVFEPHFSRKAQATIWGWGF